ncbi:hypothetical protein HY256_00895 [Candidatus Sumerlaeota bacterium]|nr:hypothetical protein [Candidatus Sumerlaeota bacterium]
MRSESKSPGGLIRTPNVLALLVVGPLFAILLYMGNLGNGLDAPDLAIVSDSANASRSLPADVIWLGSMPPEQPDLGIYRPFHGVLLKIQYLLWPGKMKGFRWMSLGLYAAMCFVHTLLVFRLIRENIGRAIAILIPAIHPMASEPVNLLAEQNVLLAGVGWVSAIYIYRLHLARAIRPSTSSALLAGCYLAAAGAYEAGFLLPLTILAVHFLANPHRGILASKTEPAPESSEEESAIFRIVTVGLPLSVVALLLLGLRLVALDGDMGPKGALQALPGAGGAQRLLTGFSAFGMGIYRLLLPLRPTFFYPVRYEPDLLWPAPIGGALLVAGFGSSAWIARKNRILSLGMILTLIPLLALIPGIPLTAVFSERALFLALPGLGIFAGELVAMLARGGTPQAQANRMPVLAAFCTILVLFLSAVTFMRNVEWQDPKRLWETESRAHPNAPGPIAYQLINLISKPKGDFDLPAIKEKSDAALRLSKPPDGDVIFQYLTLLHLQRNSREDLMKVIQDGLAREGPHVGGYYSALGVAASWANLTDLAETALKKEIEASPKDFNSLIALSELYMKRQDWNAAFETALKASNYAPSSMRALAELRVGSAAIKMKEHAEDGVRALTNAITIDRTLAEAYLELARYFVDAGQYPRADQAVGLALQNTQLESFVEFYKIQVECYERQGKLTLAYDYLRLRAQSNPYDVPSQLFAARYLLDHQQYPPARQIYVGVLKDDQNNSQALYGMGRIALEKDADAPSAYQYARLALSVDPQMTEAGELLVKAEAKLPPGMLPPPAPSGANPAPPPRS